MEKKQKETVESIEHTRREGGETVGRKINLRLMWRFIVMWNGNMDWEGLKEGCEKCEVIENIRVNKGETVGIQSTWEIEWEGVNVEWWLSVKVKISQTVESIEQTRREGGDGVGEKWMREGIDWWKGKWRWLERGIDEWDGERCEFVETWEQSRCERVKMVVVQWWLNVEWEWEGNERKVWDEVKEGRLNDQTLQVEGMWGSWSKD